MINLNIPVKLEVYSGLTLVGDTNVMFRWSFCTLELMSHQGELMQCVQDVSDWAAGQAAEESITVSQVNWTSGEQQCPAAALLACGESCQWREWWGAGATNLVGGEWGMPHKPTFTQLAPSSSCWLARCPDNQARLLMLQALTSLELDNQLANLNC